MIARRNRLKNRRRPIGGQAREQDRRLDLGAGHGHGVANGDERTTTVHGERRMQLRAGFSAGGAVKPRPHLCQRLYDAPHRPTAQ